MGSWGHGIMDGDGPCDTFGDIEIARPEHTTESIEKFVETTETRMGDAPEWVNEMRVVVGFYMVQRKIPVSETLKQKILEGVVQERSEACLYTDEELRLKELDGFKTSFLKHCEGEKVVMEEPKGLFHAMAEAMN